MRHVIDTPDFIVGERGTTHNDEIHLVLEARKGTDPGIVEAYRQAVQKDCESIYPEHKWIVNAEILDK